MCFRTATSLEIKGIAESPAGMKIEPSAAIKEQQQHPSGDLSLLAAAASNALPHTSAASSVHLQQMYNGNGTRFFF